MIKLPLLIDQIHGKTRQTNHSDCKNESTDSAPHTKSAEQSDETLSRIKVSQSPIYVSYFKLRFSNQICSFRNERYKHATELSKYIWSLKDQKIAYEINWRKVKQATMIVGPIRMYLRDVMSACGRHFSYYADQKCHLSTAEMNSTCEEISTEKCSFLISDYEPVTQRP